jgi:glutamate dehydrogenase
VTDEEFSQLMAGMNTRFLRSLPTHRLTLALEMFFRAKTRDHCQYEVRYNEDWEEKGLPSMQLIFAWRNTPKHNFLYRLARMIHRHGLVMQQVNATYIDPYGRQSILIMSLGLHGGDGQAAWDVADVPDFLRDLVTMKYFADFDPIDTTFVSPGLLTGNMGKLLRSMVPFIHQILLHVDPHLYTPENIEEALCRHPELTIRLSQVFEHKFDPENRNIEQFERERDELIALIHRLDTGHEVNDRRRRHVLLQGINFIDHLLKTNFYRNNKTAFSFRLDPKYLDRVPFKREELFPELPYGIFYIKGMHYFGYQIRFKDLARGGLRTVFPNKIEQMQAERNNVFTEAYNLSYTQHKKNKDIPEGGAKAVIFLKPYSRLESEAEILKQESSTSGFAPELIQKHLEDFRREQSLEYLHQTQRSFIEALITIINCDPDGRIRAKHVVDYWGRPEYIYLGPDERMHDNIIEWIAAFSRKYDYKPGGSFISSKPSAGINHKEFGVTSLGVNCYMLEVLKYLGIDPSKDPFTVKMSGGPDGDVAGNQIRNLHHYCRDTAKLIALTDVSGTIRDPEGLDLDIMLELFETGKSIRHYPPEKLSEGGFLLNLDMKRDQTDYVQQTLCWRKKDGQVIEDWLSGSEMNHLFRHNVHQTPTDIFIPAGGRPRTLNGTNVKDFLDESGKPSSRAIVEGANLYLTPKARRFLEDKGVLVIKDSSANKGGVICSSFEVLAGLVLGEELFVKHKAAIVDEILERLKTCAFNEAHLMLETHRQSGDYLTDISERISERINNFTYQLLDYLDAIPLSPSPEDPLVKCFLNYCPAILRDDFEKNLLEEIPEHHKKAIIACHIAAQLVYRRGLDWSPTIIDILPVIWTDPEIVGEAHTLHGRS